MNIVKNCNDKALEIVLEGRLDTETAPELEKELKDCMNDITELTFNLSGLEYVSSAGLRVILMAQKTMDKKGGMKVINASEIVREVFDVTGFSDILTIE